MLRLGWMAALSAAAIAQPQSPAPERPRFEVASIKECGSTDRPAPSTSSPGRLSLSCWSLQRLIGDAYDLYVSGKVDPAKPPFLMIPLQGIPEWARSARYSIDAKAESPASNAMMRGPMMQALLEERFHLKVRRETRESPVYVMTVAKGGAKLQPSTDGSCVSLDPSSLAQPPAPPDAKPWCIMPRRVPKGDTDVWDIPGVTLQVFAELLHPNGSPVIDRTGLAGTFDIHLELTRPNSPPSPPDSGGASDPSPHAWEIEATHKQLGLQLEPGKGPVDYLVIDHVEHPTGN